jgi:uncharacterized protein YkwD
VPRRPPCAIEVVAMRYYSFALAVLAGVSLGCQSEKTDGRRAEGSDQTYPFTPRATGNTRSTPTQLAIKGVGDPKVAPPATGAKIVPPPPPDAGQFDTNLVRMINELRGQNKLPPMTNHQTLSRVAQAHAKLLAKEKRVDANPPKPLTDQAKEAGYNFKNFSSNQMQVRALNAAEVYNGMANGVAKAQLLTPEFTDIGIGVDADGNNGYYVSIVFAAQQK